MEAEAWIQRQRLRSSEPHRMIRSGEVEIERQRKRVRKAEAEIQRQRQGSQEAGVEGQRDNVRHGDAQNSRGRETGEGKQRGERRAKAELER